MCIFIDTEPRTELSEDRNLFIHVSDRNANKVDAIVKQVSKQQLISFEEDKEKTTQKFLDYMDKTHSPSKPEIIKKAIALITPLMAAVDQASKARTFPESQEKIAPNAKITVQRRLFSTKKAASKKTLLSVRKPDQIETQKISLELSQNVVSLPLPMQLNKFCTYT